MSIRGMRKGDTIISHDGHYFTVAEIGMDRCKAKRDEPPRHHKTFKEDEIFCVDQDDGLWQQLAPGQ